MKQQLATLKRRQAVVLLPEVNRSVAFEVHEITEPFASLRFRYAMVERLKQAIFTTHDYYFTPDLGNDEHDRRIQRFLLEASPTNGDGKQAESRANNGKRNGRDNRQEAGTGSGNGSRHQVAAQPLLGQPKGSNNQPTHEAPKPTPPADPEHDPFEPA
jgi:hypothetical protein